ncbi:cytochrome C6 [Hydrococcus rivularis NIES-593]|uniref:Cytochrome c6 n=1 Tax=Hydrococcus rivularis NIES-593 TaxID=1921803 RepID=A0A1U7HBQ9_9CYAN|nr:c-type cytochrome [Hydrococcus rivularis]OKH20968.1 cytochrome C6 [Hydrococcus rivularis NIES-593]
MKRFLSLSLLVLALFTLTFTRPALAGDLAKGAKLFSANCAACHAGGKNVVNAAKTLQKGDLEKYSMNSLEAIKTQIAKGKNAMPAFAGRLSEQEIDDVANYVLSQAEKGWS